MFLPVLISLFFATAGASRLNAQINEGIRAHLVHSFMIGNTTLPPGEYTFRMMHESDFSAMNVTSENDKIGEEFIVRHCGRSHAYSYRDRFSEVRKY